MSLSGGSCDLGSHLSNSSRLFTTHTRPTQELGSDWNLGGIGIKSWIGPRVGEGLEPRLDAGIRWGLQSGYDSWDGEDLNMGMSIGVRGEGTQGHCASPGIFKGTHMGHIQCFKWVRF